MAIGHSHITTYARGRRRVPRGRTPSRGVVVRSAAAAIAYRFGAALVDPLTGELHSYTDKAVTETGIESARPTTIAESPQAVVDAIEAAERRGDSRLLRDLTVAIPAELVDAAGTDAALDLVRGCCRALAKKYDTVIPWAVHPPHDGDDRNWHAHIVIPTRALAAPAPITGLRRRQRAAERRPDRAPRTRRRTRSQLRGQTSRQTRQTRALQRHRRRARHPVSQLGLKLSEWDNPLYDLRGFTARPSLQGNHPAQRLRCLLV